MLTVSCDSGANLKTLRRLELAGLIRLVGVNIENISETTKIAHKSKSKPLAVIGSKYATIGNCVIGATDNKYAELSKIIGKQHHADVLHIERHLHQGHDLFATEDTDLLKVRDQLKERFNLVVMKPEEVETYVKRML